MPIYEFMCDDCNRVFNFFARNMEAARRTPACPKCGGKGMRKLFSRFAAISKSKESRGDGGGEKSGMDPRGSARMEQAMMEMTRDFAGLDESDPRQIATMMRKLQQVTGEPVDAVTEEVLRRLERGESPEKVEEKMADLLGELPGEDSRPGYGSAPAYDDGLYDM